jgi:hypothetical protein
MKPQTRSSTLLCSLLLFACRGDDGNALNDSSTDDGTAGDGTVDGTSSDDTRDTSSTNSTNSTDSGNEDGSTTSADTWDSSDSSGGNDACMSLDDACTMCEFASCSDAYCDCYGDPDCVLLAACTTTCAPADAACHQSCWSAYPDAISKGALLTDCAGTTCAASCPGYEPLGDCLVCLYTDCQTAMNGCISQPECTQLFVCLAECTEPNCQTACYQAHPDGTAAMGPVGNCLQSHCAVACG